MPLTSSHARPLALTRTDHVTTTADASLTTMTMTMAMHSIAARLRRFLREAADTLGAALGNITSPVPAPVRVPTGRTLRQRPSHLQSVRMAAAQAAQAGSRWPSGRSQPA